MHCWQWSFYKYTWRIQQLKHQNDVACYMSQREPLPLANFSKCMILLWWMLRQKQVQSFPSLTTTLELDWGGKGNNSNGLYTLYPQETAWFVFIIVHCQDWFLWISLSTGTVLFDNFLTIKLDLSLCCKVNIHRLVIPVHHSTKCQFWYVEIVNKTGWSTSL